MRQSVTASSPAQNNASIADLLLRTVEAEEMRRDLKKFVIGAWRFVDPAPFVDGWCIDALCDHLTALTLGHFRFLLINIPPRHSKSTICSVIWPVWGWLQKPDERFLSASYSLDLATRDNLKKRNLIDSQWFQERYRQDFNLATDTQSMAFTRERDFGLSKEQNAKRFFMNDKLGYQLISSVNASATGHGGSTLIIDDAHAADEAHSDVEREAANVWFRETWSNRMNNANKDKMLVIGQRIHEDDVSGIILKERPDWVHLNLPAEYESARHCKTYIMPAIPTRAKAKIGSFTDPDKSYDVAFLEGKAVSCSCEAFMFNPQEPCKHMKSAACPAPEKELFWEDPRKKEGELLWTQRFNHETQKRYKRDLGPIGYAAQYQQSPTPSSGAVFSRDKERFFTMSYDSYFLHTPRGIRAVNKEDCTHFLTVDPAISENESADFMVIQKWAKTQFSDLLLIDIIRGHWNHKEQQKEIEDAFNENKEDTDFIAVETTAYQHALFTDLSDKGLPCKPFKPHKDKVARAGVAAIWQQNGKMYFLKGAEWLEEYQNELYKFPKAKKKDQVDATSLAAIVVRSRGPLSDDDGNYDEIPDPIEGPIEPEVIDGRQREIPFTQPFINIEENEIPVEYVKPTIKPINPFEWAEAHYGSDW